MVFEEPWLNRNPLYLLGWTYQLKPVLPRERHRRRFVLGAGTYQTDRPQHLGQPTWLAPARAGGPVKRRPPGAEEPSRSGKPPQPPQYRA